MFYYYISTIIQYTHAQYRQLHFNKAASPACLCIQVEKCPDKSILARREGIKLSCISKGKIVSASIGSQGIPTRRDILARREHVYRPLEG